MNTKVLACLLLLPVALHAADAPFKEALAPARKESMGQPAVYALADAKGLGLEYYSNAKGKLAGSALASILTGSVTPIVRDAAVESALSVRPLTTIQQTIDRIAPTLQPQQVQERLEMELAEIFPGSQLFPVPLVVKRLGNDKADAASFEENTALIVRMAYSLTPNARTLHVVMNAEILSKDAQLQAQGNRSSSPQYKLGRVFRNRVEYFSQPAPLPPAKTESEITAKIAEIETKYAAARSAKDQRRKQQEIDLARKPRSGDEELDHILAWWMADDGLRLKEELRVGMDDCIRLLATDVSDSTTLPAPEKGRMGEVLEVINAREIYRRLGEEAGVLLSWPQGFFSLRANSVKYGK